MIMIFPGLLFALLLNATVQGAAAAVSPAHPWHCHCPQLQQPPWMGSQHSQTPAARAQRGTAVLQSSCTAAVGLFQLWALWEAQGAVPVPPAPCSAWAGNTLRCPGSWHGPGLRGASFPCSSSPWHCQPCTPLQPRLGTWPLSPRPLSALARPGSALCAGFLCIPGLVTVRQGSTWDLLGFRAVLGWPCQCWCLL